MSDEAKPAVLKLRNIITYKPMLSVPMEREDVIAHLREALSRRIVTGFWSMDEEDSDE